MCLLHCALEPSPHTASGAFLRLLRYNLGPLRSLRTTNSGGRDGMMNQPWQTLDTNEYASSSSGGGGGGGSGGSNGPVLPYGSSFHGALDVRRFSHLAPHVQVASCHLPCIVWSCSLHSHPHGEIHTTTWQQCHRCAFRSRARDGARGMAHETTIHGNAPSKRQPPCGDVSVAAPFLFCFLLLSPTHTPR